MTRQQQEEASVQNEIELEYTTLHRELSHLLQHEVPLLWHQLMNQLSTCVQLFDPKSSVQQQRQQRQQLKLQQQQQQQSQQQQHLKHGHQLPPHSPSSLSSSPMPYSPTNFPLTSMENHQYHYQQQNHHQHQQQHQLSLLTIQTTSSNNTPRIVVDSPHSSTITTPAKSLQYSDFSDFDHQNSPSSASSLLHQNHPFDNPNENSVGEIIHQQEKNENDNESDDDDDDDEEMMNLINNGSDTLSFHISSVAKGVIHVEGYRITSGKVNFRMKSHKSMHETVILRNEPYILHQIQRAHHLLSGALSDLRKTQFVNGQLHSVCHQYHHHYLDHKSTLSPSNRYMSTMVNSLILILEDVMAAVQQAREQIIVTDNSILEQMAIHMSNLNNNGGGGGATGANGGGGGDLLSDSSSSAGVSGASGGGGGVGVGLTGTRANRSNSVHKRSLSSVADMYNSSAGGGGSGGGGSKISGSKSYNEGFNGGTRLGESLIGSGSLQSILSTAVASGSPASASTSSSAASSILNSPMMTATARAQHLQHASGVVGVGSGISSKDSSKEESFAMTMMLTHNATNTEMIPVQQTFYPSLPKDTVLLFRICEDARLSISMFHVHFVNANVAANRGDLQQPNKPWFVSSKPGEVALVTEEFTTTCVLSHVNTALIHMTAAFKQCVRLRDKLSIHRPYCS